MRGVSDATDPIEVGSEPELVERIRSEIERHGPMTFARFMEMALYEPELGYYRAAKARPGREGDFLTAPETHPIFGRAIARQLAEMWSLLGRPEPFVVREYGAGSGALALAALEGLALDKSPLVDSIRWDAVELDAGRAAQFTDRLSSAGFGAAMAPIEPRHTGVVLANEFLDALPVHKVTRTDGALRELYVTWRDGRFHEADGPPSTPALSARLDREGVVLAEGQRAEVCLAIDAWVAGVAAALQRGYVLVVDYGHPAAELYGPARRGGTLRAYVRHAAHADPYRNVGRQDLTAHVDLTAVEDAALATGLEVLGVTTQAEFLAGADGDDLLDEARRSASTYEEYLTLRSGMARLLDPRAMGAFRVVVLGRDVSTLPRIRGLAFRLTR